MRYRLTWSAIAMLFVILACSCVSKPTPEPATPSSTAVPIPTISQRTPAVEIVSQQIPSDPETLWKKSRHANTFVTDAQGNNNECARCHAPMNWMPTAIEDIPSTCQTCKFNMPVPKPVAQADWKNVGCEQCHKAEKGVVTKSVAWLNAALAQFDTTADPYEPVLANTELCTKCHRDAFQMDLGKTVHAGLACTDCHNAHSTSASCTDDKCHAGVLKPVTPIPGHDAAHSKVACTACHDAAKLQVGPTEDQSQWAAFRTYEVGGKRTRTAFVSHNLQRTVDCGRCHSSGNAWGLKPH